MYTVGGIEFIVDADKINELANYKWYYDKSHKYIHTIIEGKKMYLHRLLTNAPKTQIVDHINKNTLDNRLSNLRICSIAENVRNSHKFVNNTSGYKGLYWHKKNKKWVVRITINNKTLSLGCYSDIIEAAEAYNKAAIKYFGEFASLNEITK